MAIPPQVGIPPQAGIPLQVNIPQPAGIPPQAGMPPQAAIPQQAGIPTQAGVPHHVGIPYAYGQLPVNVNPSDPKSQHPIPGSYAGKPARHGFNPRTQSFVPGSGMTSGISPGMSPVQTAAGPVSYSAVNPLPGPPPLSQSPMSFNGYQQAVPLPHQYANSGGDFGMMRQGSNNSLSPYPPPPTQPQAYQGPPPPPRPCAFSSAPQPRPSHSNQAAGPWQERRPAVQQPTQVRQSCHAAAEAIYLESFAHQSGVRAGRSGRVKEEGVLGPIDIPAFGKEFGGKIDAGELGVLLHLLLPQDPQNYCVMHPSRPRFIDVSNRAKASSRTSRVVILLERLVITE